MEISKNITSQTNLSNLKAPKTEGKNTGIDMDILSVFMPSDGVSLSQKKVDPDKADKEWYFQLSESKVSDVIKGKGIKDTSSPPVEISIIHTNDEHDNKFEKLPKEATVVRNREKFHGDENSFIVNTGDVSYEGSNDQPGPQYFGPVAEVFNSMGLEIFVPGNHEFQHGGKYLEEDLLPKLESAVLLGNVTYKDSKKPLEHTKPYLVQEMNGVKVGFIGLTTPRQATSAHPDVGYDVNVQSIRSAASNLVKQAKADGAEVVVILAHESVGRMKELGSSVEGIDIIVAGHDHKTLHKPETVRNPDGRNTLVVEAASNCRFVGDMTLEVDPKSKEIIGVNYKLFSTEGLQPDPEVSRIIEEYKKG
ncbi:MAG TPA: metallophosphoesterase [Candidatus Eremiobacteraeota bacterium]|nr:MAG: Trifunctional nucleotide phosphoesterase protein YfkN precursor [bacterium ADurb.Bin363]HPZ07426.1 metallophosphoesterase [Candidatus Eremiobacteraeota bacterium]